MSEGIPMMVPRVGIGYDVHGFARGRQLFLGGVNIPYECGLEGHSDADVLCHAIADALLGAVAERDIGHHFPNTDPQWKDVSSLVILEGVAKLLAEKNGRIINIDSMLIAEAPRIQPHVEEMRDNLARVLGIKKTAVGVKATTNEKMGFVGRREGIAAMASASVLVPDEL